MSDQQNFGLDELGQRVQAMGDPAAEPRLRPFPGAPLPIGSTASQRPASSYQGFEDVRMTPPAAPAAAAASPTPQAYQPASQPVSQFAQAAPYGPSSAFQPSSTPLNQSPFQSVPAVTSSPAAANDPAPGAGNGNPWGQVPSSESFSDAQHGATTQGGTPPATASLTPGAEDPNAAKSGFQRVVNAVRTTLPLVQRLLPLLDGNFATTISALIGPHSGLTGHPPPAQVHVDLEPIERGLTDLRSSHRDLRGQVQEQLGTLKRVEDQLERVREATDRNTLEQQELVEDLRSVGNRISTLAVVGLILLAISLGLNIYFLVQLQHILR